MKITDHNHDKCITFPEFNKLIAKNVASRLAQENLATKSDIANFVNKKEFNEKRKYLNTKAISNKANIY